MGNHSDTGELLEEVSELVLTEKNLATSDSLVDDFGSTIRLDEPNDTKPANPKRLRDSSGRDVDFAIETPLEGFALTREEAEAILAKRKKKKTS